MHTPELYNRLKLGVQVYACNADVLYEQHYKLCMFKNTLFYV